MKYSDLIEFEELTSVIKIEADSDKEKQRRNVQTYVFSDLMIKSLCTSVIPNLAIDSSGHEQKGISIVGSYGTGKSHLMSVVSGIAEDESLLQYVSNDEIKEAFNAFAGKYRVIRFEIGNDKQPLVDIVFDRIEKFLDSIGVDFHFDKNSTDSYKDQLKRMMASYEAKNPDKHLLVVIDEMLEFLKARNASLINGDLMALMQFGEMCDGSRFKIIYSVQELLYRDPMLQFAADMLNKVQARFDDVLITKEDVAFVVKNRLLKKNAAQKQRIREHLQKFSNLFDGINTDIENYVELFPVHPRYIAKFEQIKHGKNKREILKTLSNRFAELKNQDVPENETGLITYDSYWDDLRKDPAITSVPDFTTVKEKMEIIEEKIQTYFSGAKGLKSKMPLARRIACALALNILCDDLDKHLGASAETLKDDLCPILLGIDDSSLLLDTIETTAQNIVSATQGQYVVKDDLSGDFCIRTEGGINAEQIVKDYAKYIKSDASVADQNFFNLLKLILGIEKSPYRSGFNIFSHEIEWKSAKSFRLGYIFLGNSDERSTTQPPQQFYIYFCPLFSPKRFSPADEQDVEVYFDFSNFGEDFKDEVCLYAASIAKYNDASSDRKKLFDELVERHKKNATALFEKYYAQKTDVIYKGKTESIKKWRLLGEGSAKIAVFSDLASQILDDCFNEKFPKYPCFNDLRVHITSSNLLNLAQNALKKIIDYSKPNADGQAILSGLRLAKNNAIDTTDSPYAFAITQKLKNSSGKVLNRDDVLYAHDRQQELYYSCDSKIEYQLEFVVLASLVWTGEIEIVWNGDLTFTAGNISERVLGIEQEKYFLFDSIKLPQELPAKALKKLFQCLHLPDLTSRLKEADTFTKLAAKIAEHSDAITLALDTAKSGIYCNDIPLLSDDERNEKIEKLQNLLAVLDTVRNLDTYGKLKNLKLTEEEIENAFCSYPICEELGALKATAEKFESLARYLLQAKSYVESENPLRAKIESAISELPAKLSADESAKKDYENSLGTLKNEYAKYYCIAYAKARLSYNEAKEKEEILNSEKRQICEVLKDISIVNKAEFDSWRAEITNLKAADPDVVVKAIEQNPYKDFSPRESQKRRTMGEIKESLGDIFVKWRAAIKSIFDDPVAKQNMSMLSDGQKNAAERFLRDG